MLLINVLIIAVLLFFNGFFVAAEFALVGVRKTRIQQLANEGNFNAKLALDAVKNIDRYIAAVQLGITISSLGIGWVGESTLATIIYPLFLFLPGNLDSIATHTVSVSVAFAVITILHVVVGELMPKSIALQFPEKTTLWVAKPMFVVTKIFAPMIFLLNGLGNILLKLCRIEPATTHHMVHTSEELNMLIDASCKGGALDEKEAEIIQNVFKFSDLTAAQVMIPRTEMVVLPLNIELEDLKKVIIENQYTRYPVYDGDLDHIVGFVHIKDVYPQIVNNQEFTLKSLLRDILFVPETMTIDKVAMEFRKHKTQIAVVIDEFGGTSGLITHEDVMEEILGDVQDEFDEDEESVVKKLTDGSFEVCGKMRVDEFCDFFNVAISDEDVTTIGGYFVKKLGKIAEENDTIKDEYFSYCVTQTDSSRIVKLRIKRSD